MPLFAYKALAANGSVTTGEIDATDRPEALRMLDRKGLQPVNLKETSSAVQTRKPAGKAKIVVPGAGRILTQHTGLPPRVTGAKVAPKKGR